MTSDLVAVPGEVRGETALAYRFFDGTQTVWLLKSLVEWDERDGTMVMPKWLAIAERLV